MGCVSHRKKQTVEFTDLKWELINLADFKAKGCGPGFFYGYLWFCLVLSVAVYAVDVFTAVNLLAFNKWSSKIEPTIPFDVSKWIFSGCIIASFVNIAYEGVRAVRVMKRGNVAECYMDSLAARWESIRFGSGQDWKRFLVFTELTKSKKGAENVAFFTYFNFQCTFVAPRSALRSTADAPCSPAWIRVLCSGPRQVVNALTLKSVYEAKLNPTAASVQGSIVGFFDKIKALATEDYQQAAILSGMLFTLVVWIFSALFLLVAVLCYVFFLFHWLPRADGGLTGYCARKVNTRLTTIVTKKVNRALAKGQAKREKGDRLGDRPLDRSAALPTIPNFALGAKGDELLGLSRVGSSSTLPLYSSRPATPSSMERGVRGQRPLHSRTGTPGSGSPYSSRAPLVGAAAHMGYSAPLDSGGHPDIELATLPPTTAPAPPTARRASGHALPRAARRLARDRSRPTARSNAPARRPRRRRIRQATLLAGGPRRRRACTSSSRCAARRGPSLRAGRSTYPSVT